MDQSFEERLEVTVNKFLNEGGSVEDVVSALELKLMALKEEQDE